MTSKITHIFDIRQEAPEIVSMGKKRVMFTNDSKYEVGDTVLMQKFREEETPFEIVARVKEIEALRKGWDMLILDEIEEYED